MAKSLTLLLSNFSSLSNHPNAAPHKDTQWQVVAYGDDIETGPYVVDTGWDTVNKLQLTTAELFTEGDIYIARAQMRDSLEIESEWSVPISIEISSSFPQQAAGDPGDGWLRPTPTVNDFDQCPAPVGSWSQCPSPTPSWNYTP